GLGREVAVRLDLVLQRVLLDRPRIPLGLARPGGVVGDRLFEIAVGSGRHRPLHLRQAGGVSHANSRSGPDGGRSWSIYAEGVRKWRGSMPANSYDSDEWLSANRSLHRSRSGSSRNREAPAAHAERTMSRLLRSTTYSVTPLSTTS